MSQQDYADTNFMQDGQAINQGGKLEIDKLP